MSKKLKKIKFLAFLSSRPCAFPLYCQSINQSIIINQWMVIIRLIIRLITHTVSRASSCLGVAAVCVTDFELVSVWKSARVCELLKSGAAAAYGVCLRGCKHTERRASTRFWRISSCKSNEKSCRVNLLGTPRREPKAATESSRS